MSYINNISSYKHYLLEIVENKNSKEILKNEIDAIPSHIFELYKIDSERTSSGLEGLKVSKDALLSSLYYSYIAFSHLNFNSSQQQEVLEQVKSMISAFGCDVSQFEKQYDQLVVEFNDELIIARKNNRELNEKGKRNLKLCVLMADLLQIELQKDEREGHFPLPTRFATEKDVLEYNKAALRINRQLELNQIIKYKNLLKKVFVKDSELLQSSPHVDRVVRDYERLTRMDYSIIPETELEVLRLVAKHHARNLGLKLNSIDTNDNFPIIGLDKLDIKDVTWKKPEYELTYLFLLNVLKCDLLTTLINLTRGHENNRINGGAEKFYIAEKNRIKQEKLIEMGVRLEIYFDISPSVEDWEKSLAVNLSLNSCHHFLHVEHDQKIGERPWLFDFSSDKMPLFYEKFHHDLTRNLKELSLNKELRSKLSECKNNKNKQILLEKLAQSNASLEKKFLTSDPKELEKIESDLIGQTELLNYIFKGITPFTHEKSQIKNLPNYHKWISFNWRDERYHI